MQIIINIGISAFEFYVVDEHGKLVEAIIEKKSKKSIVGNVYLGKVENILPSKFAFVDIGEPKNAFLFVDDKKESSSLSKTIKKNQHLLVQAIKDPVGDKGAYVTTQINMNGRYSILVANNSDERFAAVSKKIEDENERLRLTALSKNIIRDYDASVIIRTNAEYADESEIESEFKNNFETLNKIKSGAEFSKPPSLLYYDENPILRCMRDVYSNSVSRVLINSELHAAELKNYCCDFFEGASDRISFYDDEKPIVEIFNIEAQVKTILAKKVWLKSGGFLIIEKTEALTIIDVNSGKFEGKSNNEKSKLAVNLEAAPEIARQLRLRNVSGIIIIDFIDMDVHSNQIKVLECLNRETKKDRISTNIVGFTGLGLVEMTRKKGRETLYSSLGNTCDKCGGSGIIAQSFLSAEKACQKILRYVKKTE